MLLSIPTLCYAFIQGVLASVCSISCWARYKYRVSAVLVWRFVADYGRFALGELTSGDPHDGPF